MAGDVDLSKLGEGWMGETLKRVVYVARRLEEAHLPLTADTRYLVAAILILTDGMNDLYGMLENTWLSVPPANES